MKRKSVSRSRTRLWARGLYQRLYQALTRIAELQDMESIVRYLMETLVEDARPPYAMITGARAYRRENGVYRLFAKSGQAGPVPPGFTVPASYAPVQRAIQIGWVLMRPDDPDYDPRIEDAVGVSTYAAITVGPHGEYLISFTLHEPVPDEEIIYALAAIRQVADMALRQRELHQFIHQAREIQINLLPAEAPDLPGYKFAFRARPAEIVGGDVYDFIPIAPLIVGVMIADTAGHGLPAALQARDVVVGVRMGASENLKVVKLVEKLNAVIRHVTRGSRFVSLFYCEIETNGVIVYVNAGHVPPFIVRRVSPDSPVVLTEGGPLLGLPMTVTYERAFERIAPGDILVLYTDGITEATNPDGVSYGVERLAGVIARNRTRPLPEILERVFADVDAFRAGLPQEDDQTLVLIRRRET